MKKAFGIFAIFVLSTLPAMADRKITVKWELTSPNRMNTGRYFVYDLDNECTNTSENDLYIGSYTTEYGIYGEETFICPDSKQSLTVYFDFGIRKGQKPIGMGSPTTLTNFSETLNISKQKKHTVTKKLESYYQQQINKVEQVAKQYCTQGLFSLNHTNYNYTFCCTDGYAVSNESALRATLKEIIGPYSLTINCPKQESQTSSDRDAANEEYAKQLGDSDNWQKMEAQQPIQPVAKSSSTAVQNITVSGTANAPGTSTTCADKMPEMVKKYCLNNNGNGTNSCDSKIQSISITCHDGFVSGYKTANIKQDIAKTFNFSDTSKISLYHSNKQFTAVDTTPPTGTISGIVHDTNNQPIPGATVAVVGTTNATTTDNYGKYTLKNVANGSKIEFEYLGYETQVLDAKPQMDTVKLSEGVNIQAVEVGSKTLGTKCSEEILAQLNAESGEWAKDKQTNETYCEIKCPSTHTKRTGTYSVTARSTTSTQRYKCFEKLTECPAADKKKLEDAGASETGLKHNTEICIALECKCGYTLTDGKCIAWPSTGMACTNDTKPKIPSNASAATMACNANGHAYCRVTACNDNYAVNSDETECTSERGDPCQSGDANAKRAEYKKDKKTKKLICVIKECVDGYDVNKDGTQCVPECECGQEYNESTNKCVPWTDTACNDTQKPKLPSHATSGEKKCNGKRAYCEVTACDDGFKVSDDKKSCSNVRGDECDATAIDKNATAGKYKKSNGEMTCVIQECARGFEPNKSGTKCVAKNVLSEEESQKKIDELRDNAQKMKDKEQSTENKLLGAAGIGATGIGGMMLASGMAEQNADADAETAMKAYLATFHCNYGGGKNIPGGTENVELPGGNELIALYTEYVNLANDLKARKADLGMQPGIESEAILESATSGLYDDVAVGKTSGAYVSLARALMDPEGEDAKLWAEQKDKTAQQIKTGAITAGVGAAGSLIGNLAINSGKNKQNKVDEILNKYNKLKKPFQDLESDMNAIPAKKCSEFTGTTGTGDAPNCTCKNNNEFFAIDNGGCMKCENDGAIVENNVCKCPTDKPVIKNNKCVAVEPNCKLTGLRSGNKCECIDGAEHGDDNVCKCKSTHNQVGNECQLKVTTPITSVVNTNLFGGGIKALTTADLNIPQIKTTVRISGDTAFESGSAKLTWEAEKALNKFMNQVNAANKAEQLPDTNFCIEIVGHTDRVPFKKSVKKTNEQLSQERADAVKKALLDLSIAPVDATNYKATGMGASECLKEIYDKDNEPQCRRVDITLTSGAKCTQ